MKKIILAILLCLFTHNVSADDSAIYEKIRIAIQNAGNGLHDADPYGFSLTVKVSFGGAKLYPLDKEKVMSIVNDEVLQNQLFSTFTMNKEIKIAPSSDVIFITVGVSPDTTPEIGYDVSSENHNLKISTGGNITLVAVQISAIYMVAPPRDGSILGDLKYNGGEKDWSETVFPTLPHEKKAGVNYRRLGPGNDEANTGYDKKEDWHRVGNTRQSDFQIQDRSPGHYYPSVRFRGCTVRFEDIIQDKDKEVLVDVEGSLSWDNVKSAHASKETKKDIKTDFSLHNTVKGVILDASNRPIRDNKKRIVRLQSKEWWFSDREKSDSYYEDVTFDEKFIFEDVASGVYDVFVLGQPKNTVVEVCNCNGKGVDATYECIIGGGSEYYFTLETDYSKVDNLESFSVGEYGNSGTGQVKEVAKTKVVWKISNIELVATKGGSEILKGIYDFPIESSYQNKVDYQVPEFSAEKDGFENVVKSWTEQGVPQKSVPYIFEINSEKNNNRNYLLTDVFSIIPMFDEPSAPTDVESYDIKDTELKSKFKKIQALVANLNPKLDKELEMSDGKFLEKTKTRTFTLKELIDVANGTTMSLTDKIVRHVDKQIDNFGKANDDGVSMYKKLGKSGNVDLGQLGRISNGGLSNITLFDNYNRPHTSTTTRKMTLRKSTEAEIKEAKAKHNAEIIQEVTAGFFEGMIKEIIIKY